MTPKEAFRYQCQIFHGIKPSKTKIEKDRKVVNAAKKSLTTAVDQMSSMKAHQRLTTASNQAYVILDSKYLKKN